MAVRHPPGSAERGVALFMVMLIVTLLTTVGLFALHTTTLVERVSGYARRSVQAFYVTELGTNVAVAVLGSSGDLYKALIANTEDKHSCRANAALPVAPGQHRPCYFMDKEELTDKVDTNVGVPLGDLTNALGPPDPDGLVTDVAADVRVEMTEQADSPDRVAGAPETTHKQFVRVTLSVSGRVLPSLGGATACTEDVAQAAGVQKTRAQVTFYDPIP